jgi:FkbM family methyltransferase
MTSAWRTARGVLRSMRIYYGGRKRTAAMDAFYGAFVRRGELVFDIGAHVGDRVACFRRLGARVVALEPQPALARSLRVLFALDRNVTVEQAAIARAAGTLELMLNVDNPTVSTASKEFIHAAENADGWRDQRWTQSIEVPAITLDAMIEQHGMPVFIKIDVEGFEAEALAGLSRPPAALSFEFTTIQRDVAVDAIARCETLGLARFNAALGEGLAFAHGDWITAADLRRWLQVLPHEANSGDVYARPA